MRKNRRSRTRVVARSQIVFASLCLSCCPRGNNDEELCNLSALRNKVLLLSLPSTAPPLPRLCRQNFEGKNKHNIKLFVYLSTYNTEGRYSDAREILVGRSQSTQDHNIRQPMKTDGPTETVETILHRGVKPQHYGSGAPKDITPSPHSGPCPWCPAGSST